MNSTLRIATRESKLALWQAEHVAARLRTAHPQLTVELVPMTTTGDQVLDRTLAQVGGKGLFVKELEHALLEQRADIAVHSMKDVPSVLPDGLMLCSMLERADPRDAFVSNRFARLDALPQGARVGTASLRRQCQLLAQRPDLQITALRGNVQTRLRKLDEDQYDAIVLASAGLTRLGLGERIREHMDTQSSIPAAGQGVIGIECRSDDTRTRKLCAVLNDATSFACVSAERAFAAKLEGSCQAPVAAFATLHGSQLTLAGLVASPDGKQIIREQGSCEVSTTADPGVEPSVAPSANLGIELAERALARGAAQLLANLKHS